MQASGINIPAKLKTHRGCLLFFIGPTSQNKTVAFLLVSLQKPPRKKESTSDPRTKKIPQAKTGFPKKMSPNKKRSCCRSCCFVGVPSNKRFRNNKNTPQKNKEGRTTNECGFPFGFQLKPKTNRGFPKKNIQKHNNKRGPPPQKKRRRERPQYAHQSNMLLALGLVRWKRNGPSLGFLYAFVWTLGKPMHSC